MLIRGPDPSDPVPDSIERDPLNAKWWKSGNLLVKIEIRLKSEEFDDRPDAMVPDFDRDLDVCNENASFRCALDPKKLDAKEFLAILQEKGIGGVQGYFWAFLENGNEELVIITDPILPAQPW